uniref:Ymf67 n=1 Tax=Ichthyophthirius multifiliis TaxID=5932 RepID=G1FLD9_ICHMU|nr:Ymf67 [Ichthyophthirius multifiliis]AEL89281.1 Ymf67 [Ichthyophthirius multifiliis]
MFYFIILNYYLILNIFFYINKLLSPYIKIIFNFLFILYYRLISFTNYNITDNNIIYKFRTKYLYNLVYNLFFINNILFLIVKDNLINSLSKIQYNDNTNNLKFNSIYYNLKILNNIYSFNIKNLLYNYSSMFYIVKYVHFFKSNNYIKLYLILILITNYKNKYKFKYNKLNIDKFSDFLINLNIQPKLNNIFYKTKVIYKLPHYKIFNKKLLYKVLFFKINNRFKIFLNKNYNIQFSPSNILKYLDKNWIGNINFLYIRKNKVFNKGRYSRNRQTYRTGIYLCLYINIIAIIFFYFWFYKFIINFGYCWWFLYIFFISFIFSRSLKFNFLNFNIIIDEFLKFNNWLFFIIKSILYYIYNLCVILVQYLNYNYLLYNLYFFFDLFYIFSKQDLLLNVYTIYEDFLNYLLEFNNNKNNYIKKFFKKFFLI